MKQSELIQVNKSVYDNNDYIFNLFRDYLNSLGLSWLLDDPIKKFCCYRASLVLPGMRKNKMNGLILF